MINLGVIFRDDCPDGDKSSLHKRYAKKKKKGNQKIQRSIQSSLMLLIYMFLLKSLKRRNKEYFKSSQTEQTSFYAVRKCTVWK